MIVIVDDFIVINWKSKLGKILNINLTPTSDILKQNTDNSGIFPTRKRND